MSTISGVDPRTGTPLAPVAEDTSAAAVARHAAAAAACPVPGREFRAAFLDRIADEAERSRAELVAIAMRETGFADAKLQGELTRAAFQFRFFADVVREGSYLEATVDPAADTPMGPRPDLRRILVPLGPVAVFGASNFPFAFSVLGGDTASALAAGNPVILKAHPSHPGTSLLSYEVLRRAVTATGAPDATVGLVFGTEAGAALVAQPEIKAVGFTGSLSGGRALLDVIAGRAEPIPFYGELASLNPIAVTPAAAAERAEEIGRGLVASITVGAGQLCTKPGVVLVPAGDAGDRLVAAARTAIGEVPGQVLLNERIFRSYTEETERYGSDGGIREAVGNSAEGGFGVAAQLFETTVAGLAQHPVQEIFGPVTVIARYDAANVTGEVARALASLGNSLTATLHTGSEESALAAELTAAVQPYAGRIVYDGFPTGVAVSWAQHHGGPWPSTNSIHTSVGATAIRRFLRPVTYQNAPESVLPEELRDEYRGIPRRIDGVLRSA
ncbi:aldehyde dehydrogenase (NADP(+)) [Amycolatopsis benzoatilytica]|uniref:aldehyde dehydrogenase (NADP(+)) n=1 Tax=Amycolatopsis benzoatilytica TaxID=346045 RepID=UPI00037D4C01|nr:aldehyde dehydrogenase (NADP(+)) [Amycolatopsis benzoatilytica]